MRYFLGGAFLLLTPLAVNAQAKDIESSRALRDAVTLDAIREHQLNLQNIATMNRGNRSAGTSGYEASASYVRDRLIAAGLVVRSQSFTFSETVDNNEPVLSITGVEPHVFAANVEFSSMSAQGYAEVNAQVEAVNLVVPSPAANHSSSGCSKNDFKEFTRGNIALIQRGTCDFQTKVEHALAAGATGVIIFNEGNSERTSLISSRLRDTVGNFPVLGASFAVGEKLRGSVLHGPTGVHVQIKIDMLTTHHVVDNVIAETPAGDDRRVVVVGAHLDSVRSGPGLNDNGSGSATILEIAESWQALGYVPKNKLRFIWFSAEELGLVGSEAYVDSLSHDERRNIMAMLNFDMLGSSNYARFVYDGDNSGTLTKSSKMKLDGSAFIESVFSDYFSSVGLASHPTAFNGRSDYGPFVQVGIPAGGLFSGAEGRKTLELQRIYGGTANAPFDPCYHRACDDYDHTGGNPEYAGALASLKELSEAATHAVHHIANIDRNIRPSESLTPQAPVQFDYRGDMLVR